MIKSILVALDGSPTGNAGLEQAVEWAKALKAELRGIFVEDEQRFVTYPAGMSAEGGVPVSVPLPEAEFETMKARVKEEGDAIESAFTKASAGGGLQADFMRKPGNVNDILTHEARLVDLVVIGRRGVSNTSRSRTPGPTTETLIHNALRPVVVVPENPTSGGVLFAYDGSTGVQRALVAGTEMTVARKAPVSVISIGDEGAKADALREGLTRYWKPHGLKADFNQPAKEGRVSTMIVNEARHRECGLIVMGAFGHNPIRELLFGSTTLEVLEESICPVLLMV